MILKTHQNGPKRIKESELESMKFQFYNPHKLRARFYIKKHKLVVLAFKEHLRVYNVSNFFEEAGSAEEACSTKIKDPATLTGDQFVGIFCKEVEFEFEDGLMETFEEDGERSGPQRTKLTNLYFEFQFDEERDVLDVMVHVYKGGSSGYYISPIRPEQCRMVGMASFKVSTLGQNSACSGGLDEDSRRLVKERVKLSQKKMRKKISDTKKLSRRSISSHSKGIVQAPKRGSVP